MKPVSGHSAVMLTGTVTLRTLGIPQGFVYQLYRNSTAEQSFILDELFVQRLTRAK